MSDKIVLAGSGENGSSKKASNESESDASIYRALDLIGDHDFCTRFLVPPGKVDLLSLMCI